MCKLQSSLFLFICNFNFFITGDRVKYIGPSRTETDNRSLSSLLLHQQGIYPVCLSIIGFLVYLVLFWLALFFFHVCLNWELFRIYVIDCMNFGLRTSHSCYLSGSYLIFYVVIYCWRHCRAKLLEC